MREKKRKEPQYHAVKLLIDRQTSEFQDQLGRKNFSIQVYPPANVMYIYIFADIARQIMKKATASIRTQERLAPHLEQLTLLFWTFTFFKIFFFLGLFAGQQKRFSFVPQFLLARKFTGRKGTF